MGPKNIVLFLIVIISASLLMPAVSAQEEQFFPIETFSNYTVNIKLLGAGKAEIIHHITIKNNGDNHPIVPGIAYLEVFNNQSGSLQLKDLEVKLAEGSPVVNFLKKTEDSFLIRIELWFPLRPQEERAVIVSYTAENFYSEDSAFPTVIFPVGDSSIPIEKAEIAVEASEKNITFAPGAEAENGKMVWNLGSIEPGTVEEIEFEFSSWPIPATPIKGAYVFWGLLTIIAVGIIAFSAKKLKERRVGSKRGKWG